MAKKKMKIGLSFAIVVIVMIWLVMSGFNENMRYYIDIKDVGAMETADYSKGLRVKGYLVAGSLQKENNSLEVTFVIEDKGERMNVRYAKELPDTFKDGSEILVEGKYSPEGYFEANMLMAKCPSKYEAGDTYKVEDFDSSIYQNAERTN